MAAQASGTRLPTGTYASTAPSGSSSSASHWAAKASRAAAAQRPVAGAAPSGPAATSSVRSPVSPTVPTCPASSQYPLTRYGTPRSSSHARRAPYAAPSGRITRTSSAAASAASAGRHAGSAVAHHSSARGSVASGASRSPGHTGPVTMRTRRGGCPGTRTTAVTATSGRSERLTAGADAGPGRGERTAWPGTFPASWSYRFTPRSARVNAAGQEGQTSAVYW